MPADTASLTDVTLRRRFDEDEENEDGFAFDDTDDEDDKDDDEFDDEDDEGGDDEADGEEEFDDNIELEELPDER